MITAVLASATCLALVGCCGGKAEEAQPAQASQPVHPSEFVRIEGFNLERETVDGARLRLDARVAIFLAHGERAQLEGIELTYRLPDGSTVVAHADTGSVDTSTGASEASGNAVVHTDDGFWFLTNRLSYDPDSKEIRAPEGYVAFGPELMVSGRNLLIDLAEDRFRSDGPILAQIWDLSAIEEGMAK